jgi:hypothetical protein
MVLLATAAWSLATGCALFQDLSSDHYSVSEAGVAECSGDGGGCPALLLGCSGCDAGRVCCLMPTSGASCVAPSACAGQGSLSFQFCEDVNECASSSCLEQTCTFGGTSVKLHACTKIPSCTMP